MQGYSLSHKIPLSLPQGSLISTSSVSETSPASGFSFGEEADWHVVNNILGEIYQLDN